jgi:hypothetical protein
LKIELLMVPDGLDFSIGFENRQPHSRKILHLWKQFFGVMATGMPATTTPNIAYLCKKSHGLGRPNVSLRSSKCRCGPLELPVLPIRPMVPPE